MAYESERDVIRRFLGITRVFNRLNKLEDKMASAKQQLTELTAAFSDFSADVDAKLNQLLEQQGQLEPEAQATFDELKAAVRAADDRLGDADGSDVQQPAPVDGAAQDTDTQRPGLMNI